MNKLSLIFKLASREYMENIVFTRLYQAARRDCRKILDLSSACHDWDHTLRVIANCRRLLDKIPEADAEIVEMAALLHDIGRPAEYADSRRICHAQIGAEMALKMLLQLGAEEDFAQKVSECVRTHRYRDRQPPLTIEAKIVYDGDKLDSLGAIGIVRAAVFAGHCGAKVHNTAEEALAAAPYSCDDTAYREYLVKFRHLPAQMFTEYGRMLGEERLKYMTNFFDELHQECLG